MLEPTSGVPAWDTLDGTVAANQGLPVDEQPQAAVGQPFVPPPLRARHVYLKPITPSDYPFLQMVETAGEVASRWVYRGVTPSPEQWAQTLWEKVLVQFMVVGIQSNKPIGRVVVYQPNFQDRYAYFAALRFEPRDRSPLMILGVSLFLRYVFTYWEFEKLYMEVPEYNLHQFASGLGRFFQVEGRLRGHFKMGERAWDEVILALYRDTAIQQGDALQLDYGRRSEFAADGAAEVPSVTEPSDVARTPPDAAKREVAWEEFAAEVAAIAQVPADEVREDSRVLEDLALDSLGLAELSVVLVHRYDTLSLSKEMETRSWSDVTVRALYDEYLSRVRSPSSENGGSGTSTG